MVESKICHTFALGKVAEWSIAPVLKTDELRGSGGSNPSLSARINSRASDSNLVGSSFRILTVSYLHPLRILFAPSHHTLPCRAPRNHTHTRRTVFPPGIIPLRPYDRRRQRPHANSSAKKNTRYASAASEKRRCGRFFPYKSLFLPR